MVLGLVWSQVEEEWDAGRLGIFRNTCVNVLSRTFLLPHLPLPFKQSENRDRKLRIEGLYPDLEHY